MKRAILLISIFICLFSTKVYAGENVWNRNIDIGVYDYNCTAFNGKDLYVLVGEQGVIKTSKDLKNWVGHNSPVKSDLKSVIWSKDKFIAVGDNGVIIESTDGINWSLNNSISNFTYMDLNSIIFAGNKYIIAGDSGTILVSEDGSTWSQSERITNNELKAIAYSGSKFAAVGRDGTIIFSSDGLKWQVCQNQLIHFNISDICWNGEKFVAVGDSGFAIESKNGEAWEIPALDLYLKLSQEIEQKSKSGEYSKEVVQKKYKDMDSECEKMQLEQFMNGITYNGKFFVAVGCAGSVFISKDGIKWDGCEAVNYNNLEKIIWDGTHYIINGENGTFLSSSDGRNWEHSVTGQNFSYAYSEGLQLYIQDRYACFNSILNINNKYMIVGDQGMILTSEDLKDWKRANIDTDEDLTKVIWNGVSYIVSGSGGTIFSSKDGVNWSRKYSNKDEEFHDLVWNGNSYVASGKDGHILRSLDGITWWTIKIDGISLLKKVFWVNKKFIALGNDSTILVSEDGDTWKKVTVKNLSMPTSVCSTGDYFMMSDDSGIIYKSKDGYAWDKIAKLETNISNLYWDGQKFIAAGRPVYVSYNGVDWMSEQYFGKCELLDMIWDGQRYVAVGTRGAIITGIPSESLKLKVSNTYGIDIYNLEDYKYYNDNKMIFIQISLDALGVKYEKGTKDYMEFSKNGKSIALDFKNSELIIKGKEYKIRKSSDTSTENLVNAIKAIADYTGDIAQYDRQKNMISVQAALK